MCNLWLGAGWLDTADHVASIATAMVAVIAFGGYRLGFYRRRKKLEAYLDERAASAFSEIGKTGMVSVYHLMSKIHMTEAQVTDAAFTSKRVKVWRTTDGESGRADGIMFSSIKAINISWTPADLLDHDD